MKKQYKTKLSLKWGGVKSIADMSPAAEKILDDLAIEREKRKNPLIRELREKQMICQLIDLAYGKIFLEWDEIYVSKAKAKGYVMDYNEEF